MKWACTFNLPLRTFQSFRYWFKPVIIYTPGPTGTSLWNCYVLIQTNMMFPGYSRFWPWVSISYHILDSILSSALSVRVETSALSYTQFNEIHFSYMPICRTFKEYICFTDRVIQCWLKRPQTAVFNGITYSLFDNIFCRS